jgi:hypothetical protein
MRKIGFDGGHSMYELGPAPDVALFFNCLRRYAKEDHLEKDWSLLTDRLYRRYLRQQELGPAELLNLLVATSFTDAVTTSYRSNSLRTPCGATLITWEKWDIKVDSSSVDGPISFYSG